MNFLFTAREGARHSVFRSHFTRIVCVALVASAAASCKQESAAPPPQPKPVTVAKAEKRDVPFYLDEIGNCTAYETVVIQPQVSGPVTEIHFTDGQEVKQGDLLFVIDRRPYKAALDKAKAMLAQDQAKLENARAQYNRTEELSKTKVVSSADLDTARANMDAASGTVQADQAAVDQAQINFDYCSIYAPVNGRASKRMVDAWNVVNANTTQLLLIQRQDPIYAEFTIPEQALPQVRKFIAAGTLTVEASFPDDPSKKRAGKFDFLDSGVQQASGTVRLRAVLENSDRMFWPGQFVNIRILLDEIKGAVLVPGEALQVGANGPFVFVVSKDNVVEMRPVKPGQRQEDMVVITNEGAKPGEGIQPGDTVVITGQMSLSPGAKVNIVDNPAGS